MFAFTMLNPPNIEVSRSSLWVNPLQDVDSGIVDGYKYIHTFTRVQPPYFIYMQLGIRDKRLIN